MSDTLTSLGKIITGTEGRDAVHIAVAPVTAGESMQPGTHAGFIQSSTEVVGSRGVPIGIVDPFLKEAVAVGERFWLFLYPGTITSLRHEWTHPAFGAQEANTEAAREYLENFAARLGSHLEYLLSAIEEGHYCLPNDLDSYGMELDYGFWENYTAYTGKAKPSDAAEYFRCAC